MGDSILQAECEDAGEERGRSVKGRCVLRRGRRGQHAKNMLQSVLRLVGRRIGAGAFAGPWGSLAGAARNRIS